MMSLALEHDAECWVLLESIDMRSKSGLHPYRAGLFFLLLEQRNAHRSSRKARAALQADNVAAIADWPGVRMLAHQFDKSARSVARDLADTYRSLEDGQPAP